MAATETGSAAHAFKPKRGRLLCIARRCSGHRRTGRCHNPDSRPSSLQEKRGEIELAGMIPEIARAMRRAWIVWLFVHILNLVGFRNRVSVLLQWSYACFTYQRGMRLITGVDVEAAKAGTRCGSRPTGAPFAPRKRQSR